MPSLNAFAASKRLHLFDRLRKGLPPDEGHWDEARWKEGKVKGAVQVGSTLYAPDRITFEFIYPDPASAATILQIETEAPERIVFLPVPEWVIETIWQGEIDGSFHFESDARALLAKFEALLDPAANALLFGPKQATRRE